ncbi:XRE family transcriptional regulator [Ktedonosporobacter rubrisoli]|uniref:XRE family transcriptional regulator n=1 Tax=Ktedonosporobacter rubrisoli TaxID=2509675 RepID=A0A4P6K6B4_KTERU|nr:XRE family transcriptional regulator [Ktedonosporobacter rubrisoli]
MKQQEKQRYQELGDFLRTRRARISPEQVGLPRGIRRRTPGLRREEVAQLAGVSVDWYTWLEQGREITVSTQVLESLARALHLAADERVHLFLLAHQQLPLERPALEETVSPTLQHFLDHLGTSPAYVSGQRWDIIAWNEAACAVFGDFRAMRGRERNAVWRTFTSATHRQLLVDWEGHARKLLAQFRASFGRMLGDPQLTELINDLLTASAEFRLWWPDHEILGTPEGQKALNHPQVGFLLLEHLTFQVYDAPELKVTVYTPINEADTPRKLQQLLTEGPRVPLGF